MEFKIGKPKIYKFDWNKIEENEGFFDALRAVVDLVEFSEDYEKFDDIKHLLSQTANTI